MVKFIGVFVALGVLYSSTLRAAEKSVVTFSGTAEGGFAQSWQSTPAGTNRASENQFLVDNLTMGMTYHAGEKTKLYFEQTFALDGGNSPSLPAGALSLGGGATPIAGTGTAAGYGSAHNTSSYYSGATSHFGRAWFTNLGGYIEHQCGENTTTRLGHFRMPFGMETMHTRYDQPTYYYTNTLGVFHAYGWEYDLGVEMIFKKLGPGTLEVAAADGRATDEYYPAFAGRYAFDVNAGSGTISPVVSFYTGRYRGGPGDVGFSAGTGSKFGKLSTTLEWVYASRNTTFADDMRVKDWSLYLEPTYTVDNFGDLSLKAEYASNTPAGAGAASVTDMNLGLSFTHQYADGLRVRATYAHRNLKGDAGTHTNDFRILIGTRWG